MCFLLLPSTSFFFLLVMKTTVYLWTFILLENRFLRKDMIAVSLIGTCKSNQINLIKCGASRSCDRSRALRFDVDFRLHKSYGGLHTTIN